MWLSWDLTIKKAKTQFLLLSWTFKTLFLEHMAMCRPAEKGWCRQLYIFYVISDTVPLSDIQRQNAQWLCWLVYLDTCTLSLFRHSEMLCPTCTFFSAVWWHCPFNRLSEKAKMNLKVEYCMYIYSTMVKYSWMKLKLGKWDFFAKSFRDISLMWNRKIILSYTIHNFFKFMQVKRTWFNNNKTIPPFIHPEKFILQQFS